MFGVTCLDNKVKIKGHNRAKWKEYAIQESKNDDTFHIVRESIKDLFIQRKIEEFEKQKL